MLFERFSITAVPERCFGFLLELVCEDTTELSSSAEDLHLLLDAEVDEVTVPEGLGDG